jgi:hypothetical protein
MVDSETCAWTAAAWIIEGDTFIRESATQPGWTLAATFRSVVAAA